MGNARVITNTEIGNLSRDLAARNNYGCDCVGLRIIDSADGYTYNIGDGLPPSRRWDDGDVVDGEYLNGTSAISIGLDNYGLNGTDKYSGYYGDTILVIGSDAAEWGEDVGEIVIRDARVIDTIDVTPETIEDTNTVSRMPA